ncbi:MAG: hypothetical protein ACLPH3_08860 [Terracidiphilus sp.]
MTSNTATPIATTGKASGTSFLDILSMGTAEDIFGVKSAGSGSQTGSGSASDEAQSQDEKQQASDFQAALNAGTSAVAKNTAQDQFNGSQNGVLVEASQANAVSAASSQILANLASPAKLTAAQLLGTTQPPSNTTGKAGKQRAAGAPVDAPLAAAISAASNQATVLPPASSLQQDSQTRSRSAETSETTISGAIQTASSLTASNQSAANQDRQQLADASQAIDSKAQQEAAQQIVAKTAQTFQDNLAAALPAVAQADALNQSENRTAANSGDGSNLAAQTSHQQSGLTANALAASTFVSAAILPNTFDLSQTANKASQYKTTTATFSSNANVSSMANATSSPKVPSQDPSATSSRSTGSDSAQNSQADASQTTAVAARTNDSGTAQTIAFGMLAAHQTATSQPAPSSVADTPHRSEESAGLAADPSNAVASGTTSGINSARVIQSMSETEMRVGMNSSEFGNISIRTMVSQQQVQAQISVDHSELSNAISAHIPSIQAKIGNEYGLHASIEVSQGGTAFSSDERGQSAQKDQRTYVPSVQVDGAAASTETDRMVLRAPSVVVDSDRLDIRA